MRRTRRTLVVATAAFTGLVGVGGIAAATTGRHSARPARVEVAHRGSTPSTASDDDEHE